MAWITYLFDGFKKTALIIVSLYKLFYANPKKYIQYVVLMIILLIALFNNRGVVTRFRYEWELRQIRNDINDLRDKEHELNIKMNQAKNITEIERIAREEYNFSRADEIIYEIKK